MSKQISDAVLNIIYIRTTSPAALFPGDSPYINLIYHKWYRLNKKTKRKMNKLNMFFHLTVAKKSNTTKSNALILNTYVPEISLFFLHFVQVLLFFPVFLISWSAYSLPFDTNCEIVVSRVFKLYSNQGTTNWVLNVQMYANKFVAYAKFLEAIQSFLCPYNIFTFFRYLDPAFFICWKLFYSFSLSQSFDLNVETMFNRSLFL